MKCPLMISIISMLLVGMMAMPAAAQRDDNGPPRDGGRDGRGGGGFGGRGGRGGFDGQGGPGGGPPGMRGQPGIEIAKYEALRAYIDVVDRYSKLAQDKDSAAVAAVISAADLLRQRGPEAAIQFFAKVLPDASPQVERAIRIQLADLYKQANQPDKALEQYDLLMRGVVKGPTPTMGSTTMPSNMTPPSPPPRP